MEKYSVLWNGYSDHLKQMLRELMMDKETQDVTLVCDDKTKFTAHQTVLSACSPVFKDMLSGSCGTKQTVYLRGINHQEVESLLQFMYLGEATFLMERIQDFFNVARNLEVKELSRDLNVMNDAFNPQTNQTTLNENSFPNDPLESKILVPSFSGEVMPGNKKTMYKTSKLIQDPNSKQCPDCFKDFSERRSMLAHYRYAHQGMRFPCPLCQVSSTTKTHLKEHIRTRHKDSNLEEEHSFVVEYVDTIDEKKMLM